MTQSLRRFLLDLSTEKAQRATYADHRCAGVQSDGHGWWKHCYRHHTAHRPDDPTPYPDIVYPATEWERTRLNEWIRGAP